MFGHSQMYIPNSSFNVENNSSEEQFYYNSDDNSIVIKEEKLINNSICFIYSITGQLVLKKRVDYSIFTLNEIKKGIYIVSIQGYNINLVKKILIP